MKAALTATSDYKKLPDGQYTNAIVFTGIYSHQGIALARSRGDSWSGRNCTVETREDAQHQVKVIFVGPRKDIALLRDELWSDSSRNGWSWQGTKIGGLFTR